MGCIALVLAILSLIIGIIELIQHGMTKNTLFAAIIFIGGSLSAFNLMRLHTQLKNRKPPVNKSETSDTQGEPDSKNTPVQKQS